eukprot:15457200-Alexandrium_andersonii.AAC.1
MRRRAGPDSREQALSDKRSELSPLTEKSRCATPPGTGRPAAAAGGRRRPRAVGRLAHASARNDSPDTDSAPRARSDRRPTGARRARDRPDFPGPLASAPAGTPPALACPRAHGHPPDSCPPSYLP